MFVITPRRTIWTPRLYYPPCPIPLKKRALWELLRSPSKWERQRGLLSPFGCGFQKTVNNVTTPATPGSFGTVIVPGVNDALGNYTEVISDAILTEDAYGIYIGFRDNTFTNQARPMLVNVGVDPAGGTSYSDIIADLNACAAGQQTPGSLNYYFPLFIKAGSAIAMRARVGNGTAQSVTAFVRAFCKPTRPELLRCGAYVDSIGADTANSRGTLITPGVSSAEGAWVSLGTLPRPAWWFQLGMSIDDSTMTFGVQLVDLAVGDVTNKDIIIENMPFNSQSTESISGESYIYPSCLRDLPSGAELFARISNSIATNDSNYSVVAHALGG